MNTSLITQIQAKKYISESNQMKFLKIAVVILSILTFSFGITIYSLNSKNNNYAEVLDKSVRSNYEQYKLYTQLEIQKNALEEENKNLKDQNKLLENVVENQQTWKGFLKHKFQNISF